MDYNKHIDHLIEVGQKVECGKITILTGGNGQGKSFIKKVLQSFLKKKYEGKTFNMGEISLDKRAGIHDSYDMFNRDCDWLPSSTQSFDHCESAMKANGAFMIMDEPELGMSEEMQYALANYINENKDEFLKNNDGMVIITHSRQLVKNLNDDMFLNIEGMSKDEWLNREIKPIDIAALKASTNELMGAIEKRLVKK